MKAKKFLFMALLSGVLVLSSCDLMSSKKKSKDDDEDTIGSNFQPDDYRGETGATELSEEDWEKAFSLEETIMHRSVKVAFQSRATSGSNSGSSNSVTTEIDHGKMKINSGTGMSQGGSTYVQINSFTSDGQANVTIYSQNSDGSWQDFTYSSGYHSMCMDLGILEYDYNAFTYDSSSKTYKSNKTFTYSASSYQSIDVTSCEITIKDGFPSKVSLEGSSSDGVTGTFTATYSNYGKVKVSLPNQQAPTGSSSREDLYSSMMPIGNSSEYFPSGNSSQQGGSQSQSALGTEITYNQFISAYNSRPQPNFNYASAVMVYNGTTITGTASLVNGQWTSEDSSLDFNGLIMGDEMLESLTSSADGYTIQFYRNGSNNSYAFLITGDSEVETIYLNQYFYVTGEIIQTSGMTITVEVNWSRR